MRHNWTEGRPVVYLDETWVNAHDGKNKAYEKDTTTGGTIGGVKFDIIMCFVLSLKLCYRKPSGKGEHLTCIILHAGGKDRWISGKRMH